ncbi:MAG: DNA polymerase III subunit delta [Candidatus Eisenbacteria bacterium]|nr:DNA polymerase III subunit delta [Candidatus Eisenbacteria bacterium]
MTLEGFLKKWRGGKWEPSAALVYGDEELGVGETTERILSVLEVGGASRIRLEGKRLDASAPADELSQMSLFAERRVVLLDGLPDEAAAVDDLVARVEGEPALFLLIRHRGSVDRRRRWFKRIAAGGAVFPFEAVKDRDMPDRIRERARLLGLDLAVGEAQALASRVGTDLLTARNELEKLRLYISPRTEVRAADVEAVVGRSRDTILYEITEGISRRDRARALSDLKDLMRQGIAPGAILSLLGREVRFLLQAKILLGEDPAMRAASRNYNALQRHLREGLAAETRERFGSDRENLLGKHPYVIFLRFGQASRFREEELLGLLRALSRADRKVKSGAGEPETILFTAVAAASGDGS